MSLEIIKTSTTQQAKEVISGNTVFYNYLFESEQPPLIIAFSVIRGVETDENYTGNSVISGSFRPGGFDVKNSDYKTTDGNLLAAINSTCNGLVNPTE